MLDLSCSEMTELASSFPEWILVAVAEMFSAFCLACFFFFSLWMKRGNHWRSDLLHAILMLCCRTLIWNSLIYKILYDPTHSCYTAHRLASSLQSSCPRLPRAGLTSMHHQAWIFLHPSFGGTEDWSQGSYMLGKDSTTDSYLQSCFHLEEEGGKRGGGRRRRGRRKRSCLKTNIKLFKGYFPFLTT